MHAKKRHAATEVAKRKQAANAVEPIEDAWRRIYASKLSDSDKQKLNEVKAAMEDGRLARDPSDRVNKAKQAEEIQQGGSAASLENGAGAEPRRKATQDGRGNSRIITNLLRLNINLQLYSTILGTRR
nr:hypothetical protein [Bacillus pumilus]